MPMPSVRHLTEFSHGTRPAGSTVPRSNGLTVSTRVYVSGSVPSSPSVSRGYVQEDHARPAFGKRVEQWLKTPFDIAAFGPRAAAGALMALPSTMSHISTDITKYVDLLSGPQPLAEKQHLLLREAEDALISVLERGVHVEADVLATLKTRLPGPAANYIGDLIPEPPTLTVTVTTSSGPHMATVQQGAVAPARLALASPREVLIAETALVTYHEADALANQLATELTEVQAAVTVLKAALWTVHTNANPARTAALRKNLQDARDLLSLRLASVSHNLREAHDLLARPMSDLPSEDAMQ